MAVELGVVDPGIDPEVSTGVLEDAVIEVNVELTLEFPEEGQRVLPEEMMTFETEPRVGLDMVTVDRLEEDSKSVLDTFAVDEATISVENSVSLV